jgi:hypothetical protein
MRVRGNSFMLIISGNVFQTRENVQHVYCVLQNLYEPYMN